MKKNHYMKEYRYASKMDLHKKPNAGSAPSSNDIDPTKQPSLKSIMKYPGDAAEVTANLEKYVENKPRESPG